MTSVITRLLALRTDVAPITFTTSTSVTLLLPTTRPLVSIAILTNPLPAPCVTVASVVFNTTFCVPLKFCVGLLISPVALNVNVAVSIVAVYAAGTVPVTTAPGMFGLDVSVLVPLP